MVTLVNLSSCTHVGSASAYITGCMALPYHGLANLQNEKWLSSRSACIKIFCERTAAQSAGRARRHSFLWNVQLIRIKLHWKREGLVFERWCGVGGAAAQRCDVASGCHRHRWLITKAAREEVEERKEGRGKPPPPSLHPSHPSPPLWEAGGPEEEGGRLVVTAYCLKRTHARANARRLFISPQYPSRQRGGGRDGGSCWRGDGGREREREKQAGCHCFHRGIHYGGATLKSAPAAMRAAHRAHAAPYRISLFIFGRCWDPGEERRPTLCYSKSKKEKKKKIRRHRSIGLKL